MFISRRRAFPSASAMSRRVELLPQSNAASASVTNVVNHERPDVDRRSHEFTHRICVAREVVGEVCVKALHAHARAPDPALRLDEIGAHGRCERRRA